jgi:hypothetical protein|tara:strand:+ start:3387 stop:3560 length:174 start_codon:yes stop_codon:yes gene_type:complete
VKVGDLIRLHPGKYDEIGVVVEIVCRDQYGPLDVKVLINGRVEKWEADEAEVISECR